MGNMDFQDKKLLVIHNGGNNQFVLFQHICDQLGMKVDQIADKPNDKAFGKIAGRLHLKVYEKVQDEYYHREISNLKHDYDYILVIRGEYTTKNALKELKNRFGRAKLVLYMWDSIQNNHHIEEKWPLFDRVYTFDRKDYLQYLDKIGFIPLFYCEEYVKEAFFDNYEYDLAFIGTAHGDRPKIIKAIKQECENKGLKIFCYLYCPHILVFYYNKIFNRDYKRITRSDLNFKMLPQKTIYEIYSKSKCIVDIEIKTQTGLTMRTMDVLGLKRKLITTNTDIINYDFYNTNNIMILDREKAELNEEFLKKPYEELNEKVYNKYSMKNWLIQLLK